MKFFVISNELSERKDDHLKEHIYEKYWNTDNLDEFMGLFNFRNRLKNEYKKRCWISLFMNYISLFNKIVDENLSDVVILEDDTIYDINELSNLKTNVDGIVYLTNRFYNQMISKGKIPVPDNLVNGINCKGNYYLLTGGIYIKNPKIAKELLDNLMIDGKYFHYAIDICLMRAIEHNKLPCYLVYPSIVKMNKKYKSIINKK